MLHRTRALLMRQRTMAVNALRGHLAEFGLVAAQGGKNLAELIESVFEGSGTDDDAVPPLARRALAPLVAQSLPPLEFCRGTSPSQAANSRPDVK
jgi:transposase